jgi:hypothetical protein
MKMISILYVDIPDAISTTRHCLSDSYSTKSLLCYIIIINTTYLPIFLF